MLELTPNNALDYLRQGGRIGPGAARVEPLGWGVSNAVLRVETPESTFVLKQSRPQLRTRDAWFSDLNRVYREQEVMELLYPLLPAPTVPQVLFTDRANYVFAMSHAPIPSEVWKEALLAGRIDTAIAERAGLILGRMHEATAKAPALLEPFRDNTVFIQLRVDPFYRRIQERRPEVADAVGRIADRMLALREALCHGDYSPKNILTHAQGFTLVDYETAHFGDPTMDLGFFLSHLILKALKRHADRQAYYDLTRTFWRSYGQEVRFRPSAELEARTIEHFAVCLLARIDGTSPVDYLPEEPKREAVRRLGRRLLRECPVRWEDALALCETEFADLEKELRMSDPAIKQILAREVLDSRGNPTVEVEVHCRGGAHGRAIVPSGASTGRHEAVELRDGDPQRFRGKGVRRAVANVRAEIAPHLLGLPTTDQALIDRTLCELDGTPTKARLGANAILGVSLASAHAGAAARNLPLWRYLDTGGTARMPLPMVNLISGGLHAGGNLDFQDFLLLPIGARSYSEALAMTVHVYRALGEVLTAHGFEGVLVGDEGGYGPRLPDNERAVQLILEALRKAGLTPGRDAGLAVDVASSHFYADGCYRLQTTGGAALPVNEMVGMLQRWVEDYPIYSVEDGMAEDDWEGWQKLTAAVGQRVQLIGDDLFTTNPERLRRGIESGVANAVLVKVNQIGTLTETLEVIAMARAAGYRAVISARSGETEDCTIADLAVATGAGQIKIGSVARSERLAKYNQLLRIEEELGGPENFARWQP